jgi:hypothetical protein
MWAVREANGDGMLQIEESRMRVAFVAIGSGQRSCLATGAILAACLLSSCERQIAPSTIAKHETAKARPSAIKLHNEQGRTLAAKWCAVCHLVPEAGDLPREKWPYMIKWMGNYLGHANLDDDVKNLIYSSLVPTQPAITRDELAAIESYYVSESTEEITPAFPRDGSVSVTSIFRPEPWPGYGRPLTVSLVKIDASRQRLYLGAAEPAIVHVFSAGGQLLNKINCNENPAVTVRPTAEGFDLVLIGNLDKDLRQGTLHRIIEPGATPGPLRAQRVIEGFYRTSGGAWGDLDGDGHDDVVMAGFGDYEHGALAWFSVKAGEAAVRHDLRTGSGAIDAVIDDVDADGDLDILSVIAQGHQEMWWFENSGSGTFHPNLLWKERPGMGYNAFQWTDFDADGRKDLIFVSGNNMEMNDPPLKPVHGIYVYLQTSPMQFKKTHFLRMDGPTKALAGDYDRDGDTDVAAISAYPDWRANQPVTFALFSNEGNGRFTPTTISPYYSGQLITMDSGDLDGDGDLDIVLGGANWAPLLPEPLLSQASARIRQVPAAVLLRNQLAPAGR